MKHQSKTELSQLLSSYVDGELSEQQAQFVEAIVSQNPEARKELEELKALKSLLVAKKPIPPSIGFWTRLSLVLEQRKKEEADLLPFPRKYLPLVATVAAVAVVAVGIVLFQQRASVVEYVSKQSERVQKAVEDNVLKGSIMPLFSRIDKNQALQFAMFGTLPLDAKAETELRVNEDSVRGYTIDVDKKSSKKIKTVTVKELVDEVQPSHVQLQIIDSLLDLGRQKLEGSVFVAEDRAMAVDPQLSRLNRVMLSGIAAVLEPHQRVRFERFLKVRSAPYTLTGGRRSPESSERILHTLRIPQQTEQFLVVTPETVVVSRLQIDVDSVRRHYHEVQEVRQRVSVHVNGLIRRIAEHDVAARQHFDIRVPQVRVVGDSQFFSIQIGTGWDGMPDLPREMWVKPRPPVSVGLPGRPRGQLFNFQFNGEDSSFFFNIDLDSIMIRMRNEGAAAGIEFFKVDPRLRDRGFPSKIGRIPQMSDSAFVAKKRAWSKLDSLMREMEKREKRRNQTKKNDDSEEQLKF